jgi:S1-C subfamily serine protease
VAFRQDRVLADLRPSGLKEGDVVIGVDGQALEMTLRQFLAHVRTSYVSGDKVTLNVLREGKRLDLPLTLR